MDLPAIDLPVTFKATASNVFENDESDYGAQFAFDDDDKTRWATDNGTKQAWIAVHFVKPQTANHIRISEAYRHSRARNLSSSIVTAAIGRPFSAARRWAMISRNILNR